MTSEKLRRFSPTSIFAVTAIERWLENMALDGWLLAGENAFFGWFVFHKAAPSKIRYRLEVAVHPQNHWDGDPKRPWPEEESLHQQFGWDFVLRHRDFYIYRSTQPHPRDVHTDPQIQAMTLRVLNTRQLRSLAGALLILLFHIFFGIFAYPFVLAMVLGSGMLAILALLSLAGILEQMYSLFQIRLLRRQILGIQPTSPEKNRRKTQFLYPLWQVTALALSFAMVIGALCISVKSHHGIPITEYPGEVPFVVPEDLVPPAEDVHLEKLSNCTYQIQQDLLYPLIIDWTDGGVASYGSDLGVTAGILEVQYCEAATPWLAQRAARDFTRFYQNQGILRSDRLTAQPLPELGLDYALGFYNQFGLVRVVLAHGNTAVCARFSMGDPYGNFTAEAWANEMTQRLLAA